MRVAVALAPVLAALVGCFAPVYDQPRCGPGDTCPAPLVCSGELCLPPAELVDAAIDSLSFTDALDATDGPTCTPRCEDRDGTAFAVTCTAADEACPLGCAIAGGVHCQALVPSNGVTAADLAGADLDLVLEPDRLYLLDGDTGLLRSYAANGSGAGAVVRAAGVGLDVVSHVRFRATAPVGTAPGLAVLGVHGLTVPATTVLRAVGSRAVVIVARGPIAVAGAIDVGAGYGPGPLAPVSVAAAGPGGGRGAVDAATPAQGCAPGGAGTHAAATNRDTGGGGGGLGLAGGRGGASAAASDDGGSAVVGGMLGAVCGQTHLVPLRGGSGGGIGQSGDDGGGGGGALQLTSLTAIAVTGTLQAGGAGGDGSLSRGGGGGGGSGGAILLEAPTVTIDGARVVTGGGGGGDGNGIDDAGDNGRRDGQPAASSGNGGRGGTGPDPGAGEFTAADGSRPGQPTGGGTGGGGGGSGIVHLRSLSAPSQTGAIVRPTASISVAAIN